MQDEELLRYSRHILLDEIGIEGQQRWCGAHALVIGAGGLGCPAAMYLACAGVGQITLADHDSVELTNLQRQIGHSSTRLGQSKVDSLRQTLHALNPLVRVNALPERAQGEALAALVAQADVVLDCSDNYQTRHAVNHACVALKKPLVAAAAIRFDAQISVYDARDPHAPCYACAFAPDATVEETACATMGVFAPLVGIIGAMQAAEALKLLAASGTSLAGKLLMLDARTMEWTTIRMPRNPQCTVCQIR